MVMGKAAMLHLAQVIILLVAVAVEYLTRDLEYLYMERKELAV